MNTKDKGVVLISILLIVLLLSSVAVLFGNKYFLSLKRAQYIEFQTMSLNIFRNIESLAKDKIEKELRFNKSKLCLLYTSPSPRDRTRSRMPSSA